MRICTLCRAAGLLLALLSLAAGRAGAAEYYGYDPGGSGFAPLDQITPGNVDQLAPAWTYHTRDLESRAPDVLKRSTFEVTPILVGDKLVACTPFNAVVAVDPGTGHELWRYVRPGRLIIVDLRDQFIEKDEALGLFVVLLQLFADAKYRDENGVERSFNKLVVFDEAHKYIESPDLVSGLIEVVREMRHKGTSIMVASQDPPSVPVSLIELSSQVILHKFNSPAWLKHLQKANAALGSLTPEKMSNLRQEKRSSGQARRPTTSSPGEL